MVKAKTVTSLIVVAGLLLGCRTVESPEPPKDATPADLPDWVARSGVHPQYPKEQFLVGFGSVEGTGSEAIAEAMQRGRDEIAFEIQAKIETSIESIMKEMRRDDKATLEIDLTAKSRQVSEEILQGSRRVATYEDRANNMTYVLVAMGRKDFAERVLAGAEDTLVETKSSLATGKDSVARESPSEALQAYLRCVGGLAEVQRSMARALAVLPNDAAVAARARGLRVPEIGAEIEGGLTRLTGAIRVEALSGDGQTGAPGTALPDPLVVRAVWRGPSRECPVAGFPVRVDLAKAGLASVHLPSESTDRDGKAQAYLRDLKMTGEHANPVTIGLDYVPFAGNLAASYARAATLTYFLPTVASTKALVVIHETIEGRQVDPPISETLITDKLTSLGLAIVKRDASMRAEDFAAMSTASLQERFKGQADYVITGTVAAASRPGEQQGNIMPARARVTLQAVELLTARVLALELPDQSDAAKGFALNAQDACRKAIRNSVNQGVLPKLQQAFKARLAGGEKWGDEGG
ncbi:MAG: LPP20 family lipoprotein [Planctomycetota bacterium]